MQELLQGFDLTVIRWSKSPPRSLRSKKRRLQRKRAKYLKSISTTVVYKNAQVTSWSET